MKIGKYPLLEDAIIYYLKEERTKRHSITGPQLRRKALALSKNLYPGSTEKFTASYVWFRRMIRRNNISFRRVTSVGQEIPEDAPERCDSFLDELKSLNSVEIIMNMDEMLYIDEIEIDISVE